MEINDTLVDHLATLGRLHFSPAEKEQIKADLEKMTGFISKLNELDTQGVEPLRHMHGEAPSTDAGHAGRQREDLPGPMLSNAEALREARQSAPPFFVVPKVLPR